MLGTIGFTSRKYCKVMRSWFVPTSWHDPLAEFARQIPVADSAALQVFLAFQYHYEVMIFQTMVFFKKSFSVFLR